MFDNGATTDESSGDEDEDEDESKIRAWNNQPPRVGAHTDRRPEAFTANKTCECGPPPRFIVCPVSRESSPPSPSPRKHTPLARGTSISDGLRACRAIPWTESASRVRLGATADPLFPHKSDTFGIFSHSVASDLSLRRSDVNTTTCKSQKLRSSRGDRNRDVEGEGEGQGRYGEITLLARSLADAHARQRD